MPIYIRIVCCDIDKTRIYACNSIGLLIAVLSDEIVKSVLCREMLLLHTIVLSVYCASVTDKTFLLIGQ